MIAVVLDSNAIHRDPWLTNEPGGNLLARAADGSCRIVFPKVVIDELRRQRGEAVREHAQKVSNVVTEVSDAGVDVKAIAASATETFERLDQTVCASFNALLARPGVAEAPIPRDVTAKLVERDLARRRPFLEVGSQAWSTGFRDAVIWETVLEILRDEPSLDRLVLVTADKGFLADDSVSIHQDLLDDLDANGISRVRLANAKTTFSAQSEVDKYTAAIRAATMQRNAADPVARLATVAASEAAGQAQLVSVATEALFELIGEDISLQMVYGGDYDYPDFVKFTVPQMEGGSIESIDQETEFQFVQDGDVIHASARAWISIEGATFKGDWFVDAGESLTLTGELNDHYFETSSELRVVAAVEIDVSGESPVALGIVLTDDPSEPGASVVESIQPGS